MISPNSLKNLRHDGRPRAFSEADALAILKTRRIAGATSTKDFIEGELAEGNLKQRVSVSVMSNLLSGRMYPDLIDPDTGQKFDYSQIPKAPSGRPSRFGEDGIDPVTKERRRGIPPLRQWLLDKTLDEARRVTDARCLTQYTTFRRQQDEEVGRINERFAVLEKKIAAQEARIKSLEENGLLNQRLR